MKATETPLPAYSRDQLENDLRDGFRKQQQRINKERQVEHLVLAKGLGEGALSSLKEGCYYPHKALPPLKPEEKKLFERKDLMKWCQRANIDLEGSLVSSSSSLGKGSVEEQPAELQEHQSITDNGVKDSLGTSLSSTSPSLRALKEYSSEDVRDFLEQLRSTSRAAASLRDARAEVEENIQMVEAALLKQSAPLSFEELLDVTSRLLAAMERGELAEDVVVEHGASSTAEHGEDMPTNHPGLPDAPSAVGTPRARILHGALEVEAYTREHLLPKAFHVIAIAHTAEWMLQYTMVYLRTTAAVNTDEAFTRLNLLARCVRLLGDLENFSSVLLSLETKCEEYAGFVALRDKAEYHLDTLLGEVEGTLDTILSAPFPSRRSRLLLMEGGIRKKLQRALLFLNEIDYSWTPHVRFHWKWKMKLLSASFHRIHGPISRKYMHCSMGFIDGSLYEQVADTRITGRYMGASPIQPKVLRARQVEYEKITEGLSFQQIGMSVKGLASLVVGEQLCMGARFILHQSTKDFDSVWGFHMDEVSDAPTAKELSDTVAVMLQQAKQQYTKLSNNTKMKPSLTFITQS
ncbi:hypothetical protein GH5_02032 [Leishmania sp. Ghana 2012 LV757]|uniref:hypothetical protein n=1 Tax=Leishmania sp. Ghana 2012 LV757 TaxID=2803181 RepID=UPI001B5CF8AA|nr:hypothetical protein GH5_02032 [Leishmania sp. Ghana 2012 LV757]